MQRGPYKRRPLAERFWSKVAIAGPDECWEWTASRTTFGYGQINIDHKPQRAHRVAWELAHGPIPDGLCVLHSCDNPPCVNPAHLRIGTDAENIVDMWSRERRTRSPRLRGEAHGRAKLTDAQVAAIRERFAAGESQSALGREYGVSQSQVHLIVRGESRL
jgi:hypothetical protein